MKIYIKSQVNIVDLKDQLHAVWMNWEQQEREMVQLILAIKDAAGDKSIKLSEACSKAIREPTSLNIANVINAANATNDLHEVVAHQMIDRPTEKPKKRPCKCPQCKGDAEYYQHPVRKELDVVECPNCGGLLYDRRPPMKAHRSVGIFQDNMLKNRMNESS